MKPIEKPIKRSKLRAQCGMWYYGMRRKLMWIKKWKTFARTRQENKLPYQYVAHKTILLRKLKDVEMWLQYNKVVNLKLATGKLSGIVIKPGEVFSYWQLIGKPTKREGYVDGMILSNGTFTSGTGGGLCQLSNLIFWMTIHTPLTVVERHRHGYDVFPDSNRTQPFGSGATCFYPHGDLMIQNNTQDTYQLLIHVGDKYLEGEWRVSSKPVYTYKIVEKNHRMQMEYWGGYSRYNELYQQCYNSEGRLVEEVMIVQNAAIMMYAPFLEAKEKV